MRQSLFLLLFLFPIVASSQNFLDQFPYHKQTHHFDFRFRRNSPANAEIAHFANAFIDMLNRDFLKADFDYPIRVLVLEDRARFKEFLHGELEESDPPNFGIYLPHYKLFVTYEDSGLGTFAHEILHPLVERNMKNRPLWAKEGIPTFFEKFYGYWEKDKLIVYWGFQNPWRVEQLGTNLVHLDLKSIIADPNSSTSLSLLEREESDLRMASVFLWERGRFKRFLHLVASQDKAGYPTYFEAAMGLPLEKILPLWQRYLNKVSSRKTEIMKLPGSRILENRGTFEAFVRANQISLEQPQQNEGSSTDKIH